MSKCIAFIKHLLLVFLPRRGWVTNDIVNPTEIPHVSDNRNIVRVRAALKALATWWQTILLCSEGMTYGPGAKGRVTPTENLES